MKTLLLNNYVENACCFRKKNLMFQPFVERGVRLFHQPFREGKRRHETADAFTEAATAPAGARDGSAGLHVLGILPGLRGNHTLVCRRLARTLRVHAVSSQPGNHAGGPARASRRLSLSFGWGRGHSGPLPHRNFCMDSAPLKSGPRLAAGIRTDSCFLCTHFHRLF